MVVETACVQFDDRSLVERLEAGETCSYDNLANTYQCLLSNFRQKPDGSLKEIKELFPRFLDCVKRDLSRFCSNENNHEGNDEV